MKVRLANECFLHKKFRILLYFVVLIVLFSGILSVLTRLKPVFTEKASILAKARATEVINSAIIDVFSGIESDGYVNIITKDTGVISSISTDSVKINKLKANISRAVLEKAEQSDNLYVHIPLGSLTNHPVLQGMGYRIPVKVSLDGVTKTDIEEEFINAGINQVKNRIYIIVSARISIVSSLMTISEVVSTQVPVSETIIVGEVPEYYGDKLGVVGR